MKWHYFALIDPRSHEDIPIRFPASIHPDKIGYVGRYSDDGSLAGALKKIENKLLGLAPDLGGDEDWLYNLKENGLQYEVQEIDSKRAAERWV